MKFTDIEDVRIGHTGGGGRERMGADEIRMAISSGSKTDKYPTCRAVLGGNPIDHLRWKRKDKIRVRYTKTQLFLKRSDDGSYRIQKNGRQNVHYRISFPCFPGMPFSDLNGSISSTSVNWEYRDGGLLIDYPKEQENGS